MKKLFQILTFGIKQTQINVSSSQANINQDRMLKKKKKERELVKVNLSMGLSALAEMNNVYQIYNSAANNYKTGQNWKTENLGL